MSSILKWPSKSPESGTAGVNNTPADLASQTPVLRWIPRFFRPEAPLYVVGRAVAAVMIILLIIALWSSFRSRMPTLQNPFQFSLQNYRDAFASPVMAEATRNTFVLATGITVVSVLIAIVLVWLIHRTSIRFEK